ncbi:MAG TPA: hypothetical protein VFU47_12355, partial [Armatimonadota bacterium]|nr:hypothetical protein [Armatimonadota bacterium]
NGCPLVALDPELHAWLRGQKVSPGDSLLVESMDGDRSECAVRLERREERDDAAIDARSRDLAEKAAFILRQEVRGSPVFPHDLTGWLLSMGFYQVLPPPDPLELVLLTDARFAENREGQFTLATKWEWVRQAGGEEPWHASREFLEHLRMLTAEAGLPAGPDTRRRVDVLELFRPWLQAVGRHPAGLGAPPSPGVPEADRAARRRQVYRLRVAPARRPSVRRVLELKGDQTLQELDTALRRAFRHDRSDHLSGFAVQAGPRRPEVWLAIFNPFSGLHEGEDYALADLNLEPGDEWSYTYDFGDWIRYTITVESIAPAQPRVTYPRLVTHPGPSTKRAR